MRSLFLSTVPWITESDEDPEPRTGPRGVVSFLRLGSRTVVLLAAFIVLQRVMLHVCRLPEEASAHESILFECLKRGGGVLMAGLALLFTIYPRLRQGWTQFEGGAPLRWFVGALATILAWAGSAHAYNAWYDQPHTFDRLFLIVLAALVFWRPIVALPFAGAFWAVIWQFDHPSIGFQSAQAQFTPIVNTLTLFSSAFIIRAVCGGRRMDGFLFLTLCLVAANFWVPGHAKLHLGWITHGHVYLLFPGAYTHGWLAFLDAQTVASITSTLALFDWPMRIGTLCVELGALILFLHVRVAKSFLVLSTLMLGCFFLTLGYLFWNWLALHVALWVLLFRTKPAFAWRRDLFTRGRFVVSLFVITSATYSFAPAVLAWFDTPLVNTIRYDAVGRSGAVYELPPSFFAPYDTQMAMGSFVQSLAPALTSSYGVTYDRATADALLVARTPTDVLRLEHAAANRTTFAVDAHLAEQLDELLRRTATVSNRNLAAGSHADALLALLRPPPFIWTYPHGTPYRREEPIARVRVYRVSSFFDGRTHTLFRKELLRTVPVPP